MKPTEILKAIAYPLTESAVLIPMIVFWLLVSFGVWLLVSFGIWGKVLGPIFLILVLPAVFRFLMIVLESRAHGRTPPAPGVESFHIYGNGWSLFPVIIVVAMVLAKHKPTPSFSYGLVLPFLVAVCVDTTSCLSLSLF